MHLGLRLLFGVFLILGLAAFFVFNVFVHEVRPSVAQVMEDVMIDSANVLAELARNDLAQGRLNNGDFARALQNYRQRNPQASVWGLSKQHVDFRVYVTDARGVVQFDSEGLALGQDYSRWNDVYLTLRGRYGARTTPTGPEPDATVDPTTLYVAAPVLDGDKLIGVLTLAKATATVAPVVEKARAKILREGAVLLGLSLLIGLAATLWIVGAVRRLVRYADAAQAGRRSPPPQVPGELGRLAQAMDAMRARLEGQHYVENTVRALTHELKSPLAAIRGAGELLREPMADADRERFANHVVAQSQRMQSTIDRLLELSKLEQRAAPENATRLAAANLLAQSQSNCRSHADAAQVQLECLPTELPLQGDAELLQLALDNLTHNAVDFSPTGGVVQLRANMQGTWLALEVVDQGPGFADFVQERLGQRFVSTPRPNGGPKGSGLGLAIAQQVAQLHGGSLQVSREAHSTCVRLLLPADFTQTSQTSFSTHTPAPH